ncbi:MAG: hypothetical protein Q9213_004975 [Squamulea squamosa]
MAVQSWQKAAKRQSDPAFGGTVTPSLQIINRILRDEIHNPAPHLCIQNVATAQVYLLVYSIGVINCNEQAIKETLRFFGLLVDSEDEDFINDASFADRLLVLVQAASSAGTTSGSDIDTEIAELLFAVTAKLRQQPEISSAWFRPGLDADQSPSLNASTPVSKSEEFPLVFKLLEYVHYDGKVGDFARTGLLYILESTGRSYKLQKWIIESELATMTASGLGALYSQLSSKVALAYANGLEPPVLVFSNVTNPDPPADAEPIFSNTVQTNLTTFLSYLAFWQDMLERCPSIDIKATLLDHFDFLFLRPVLYPSLVESSDVDSGSSVAVMTYLRCIFDSITHTNIIRLLLHYMLGSPGEQQRDKKSSRPTTLARRRKSETLIANNANGPNDPSPDLLTLTNILQGYLASRNQQTITASLRLLATILRLWHHIAATKLFKMQLVAGKQRPIEAHNQYLDILYSMVEGILDDESLEAYYEAHLQDAQATVELHSCSARHLIREEDDSPEDPFAQQDRWTVQQHSIIPDDPLFLCLLSLLEDFLVNDIEINLSLSETLAALASCSNTSLDGWLLGPSSKDISHHIFEDTAKTASHPAIAGQPLGSSLDAMSPILTRLSALVERIDKLRGEIQDFDIYLAERRHVFRIGEEIDDVVAEVPNRRSHDLRDGQISKHRDQVAIGSISERLKASSNVSRSSSPRGRPEGNAEYHQAPPKSLVGRLSQLRLSPSRSPSKMVERPYSHSPLRRTSTSSRTSSGLPSPRGPPDVFHRKIRLKANTGRRWHLRDAFDSETSSIRSESTMAEHNASEEMRDITLSHLLTNIIILQEFILELATIIQVRASMFGEVMPD